MNPWVYGVVFALCGVAALVYVVDLVRDRNAQDSHFVVLGLLEVVLLVQASGGCIAVARTGRDVETAVFISYLVSCVLVPVVAAMLSLAERSRVGTAILLFGVVTVAGLELRLLDIWGAV